MKKITAWCAFSVLIVCLQNPVNAEQSIIGGEFVEAESPLAQLAVGV